MYTLYKKTVYSHTSRLVPNLNALHHVLPLISFVYQLSIRNGIFYQNRLRNFHVCLTCHYLYLDWKCHPLHQWSQNTNKILPLIPEALQQYLHFKFFLRKKNITYVGSSKALDHLLAQICYVHYFCYDESQKKNYKLYLRCWLLAQEIFGHPHPIFTLRRA